MRQLIIVILLVISSGAVTAQADENPWQKVTSESNQLKRKLTGKKFYVTSMPRGTVFLHDTYLPVRLTLEDGEVYDSVMARYNSYLDELVCFNDNINTLFTIDKYLVKEFEVVSPVYGYQKFRKIKFDKAPKDDRFFQVVYEGNIILLAFYKTIESKTSLYKDEFGILRDTEYALTETFYTYSPDEGLNRFYPYKSTFLKMYNANKSQVRQILRKNKISNFNIKGLQSAFSLIEQAGITQ